MREIASIPAVIWSAIIAALITLFGIWLQNRAQDKRQREQFIHDSEKQRIEREMTLRRDIYLAAAEATAQQQEYILSFASLDMNEQQQGQLLQGSVAALNRVQIIATLETLKAFKLTQDFFAHSVIELVEKKLPIKMLQTEIAELNKGIEINVQASERYSKIIETSGAALERVALVELNGYVEKSNKDIMAGVKQLEEVQHKLEQSQIELLRAATSAGLGYSNLLVECVVRIRCEIDLALDDKTYREMAIEGNRDVLKHFEEMIQRATKLLE